MPCNCVTWSSLLPLGSLQPPPGLAGAHLGLPLRQPWHRVLACWALSSALVTQSCSGGVSSLPWGRTPAYEGGRTPTEAVAQGWAICAGSWGPIGCCVWGWRQGWGVAGEVGSGPQPGEGCWGRSAQGRVPAPCSVSPRSDLSATWDLPWGPCRSLCAKP